MPKPKVTCYCDTDLIHSAHAVAGLIDLAAAGEIDLEFDWRDKSFRRPQGHWTLWMRVDDDGDQFGVCVDCHDYDRYLCRDSLAACRAYFKSNLTGMSRLQAPPELRSRLQPYGPYLPARSVTDRAVKLRTFGSLFTKIAQRLFLSKKHLPPHENLRAIRHEFLRGQRYRSRKTTVEYESSPQEGMRAPNVILYNPSCWDESEGPEIRMMNQFRAELIVALRKAFGPRFIGGFRKIGPSFQRYPYAIEDRELTNDEYVQTLARSNLSVYTNGKWGCFSWRFAEVLAASKCIVSEIIPNDAGIPLDENVGVVQRSSLESMVDTLLQFDCDPNRTLEYAHRVQRYYSEYVKPQACMRRLIEAVCSRPLLAIR